MKKNDEKVIGYMSMTNFGGLEVLDIEYDVDDYIIYRWYGGRKCRSKIRENTVGLYFNTCGRRIYLDDIIRV